MNDPTPPPPPPVPAQPLEYAYRMQRRPAIVTAVGVMSIVVGIASIAACALSILVASGFYQVKRLGANLPAPQAMTVSATARPAAPDGFGPRQRQVIGTALKSLQDMPQSRLDRLDHFLAQHGQRMFPSLSHDPEITSIEARVQNSGAADGPEVLDPHTWFTTLEGRLDLYDDRATFAPADGGAPIAVRPEDPEELAAAPTTAPTTLPTSDVQAAIDEVQTVAGDTPLNDAQLAALRQLLEAPNQDLVMPSAAGTPIPTQVAGAHVDEEDDSAMIVFMSKSVTISSDGQTTSTISNNAFPRALGSSISGTALGLVIAEGIASALLALFLIIAGVATLANSFVARRLHWIYVAIKIPLAVVSVVAWAWLLHGLFTGISSLDTTMPGQQPTGFVSIVTFLTIVLGVAGLVYPIALLFALRSKAANAYYSMVT